ncbi:Mu transposase C-terminal domain-containing protein [Hydrogenophaga sp. ANAO-22]|uniref:Mu transposase C-terminal domain-containing protein n=1 Tax=Hydrogenophaga sp. ANAO-22 TaxID=3166645 RepID=UPI0036D2C717
MLSFARGLVLSRGLRTFEFERALEEGKVQFKFLDTFEVRTFQVSKLYNEILAGDVKLVHPVQQTSQLALDETVALKLPSVMTPLQDALIAFRMVYIKAAIRDRASPGSIRQLNAVIARVDRNGVDPNIGVDAEVLTLVSNLRTPTAWTLMNWLKRYRHGGANPYVLCDLRPLAKRAKRLTRAAELIMEAIISKHFLQLRGKSIKATHDQVRQEIEHVNRRDGSKLTAPSEKTVARRIQEIPEYVRDMKRFGIAYARNKWRFSLKGDQSTRILERVEIDHTLLDIWVLDPLSGVPLGRPWITVVMDRFSGYVLGLYISFYGPSCGTVTKAIKCSILPKGDLISGIPEIDQFWSAMGVPECFVVDNGLEFHSRSFRRIAWNLRCDLIYNPVRQPWLKASIERVMMEFNRILPLQGKVFAPMKNAQRSDPAKTAAILFDDLCSCLLIWAAKVHPFQIHPKTLVRPVDLWEEGRASSPPSLLPTDLSHLELAAGISTERVIGGDGIFFHYMRYNSPELQDYRRGHGETFRTEIRFDPDNLGWMHVHLPKAQQWIQVQLQRPHFEYGNGLSLLQHELIRKEAGARLTRVNAEEVLLIAQRDLNDRWNLAIKRGIKTRKDADLIRAQGLTSASVVRDQSSMGNAPQAVPEASPAILNNLPQVMPFKAYSVDEEYA